MLAFAPILVGVLMRTVITFQCLDPVGGLIVGFSGCDSAAVLR